MEFDNSFDVPLSPAQAWAVLMDIRRIAPCMPGAALTEIVDAQNFRGKIAVRLGPVALAFAGRVQFEDVDDVNHSARVKAQGADDKGRGSANATATFRIEPADIGSRVFIHTDLMLSGAVAQYGRGVGMIQATAAQIIGQFAANLRAQLERQPPAVIPPAVVTPEVASPPIVPERTPAPPRGAPRPASVRPSPPPEMPPPPAAKPISGLTLLARVIWQQVRALFSGRKD
jgi:carbon monoxide dehydrogenase subunit G